MLTPDLLRLPSGHGGKAPACYSSAKKNYNIYDKLPVGTTVGPGYLARASVALRRAAGKNFAIMTIRNLTTVRYVRLLTFLDDSDAAKGAVITA